MQALSADTLLTAWEAGRARHPIDRALLLYALAAPGTDPESLADRPLGQRNAALLKLRQAGFGNRLRAYLDCPACGERLEFGLDASRLLASAPRVFDDDEVAVAVDGLRFRLPTSRDLACVAGQQDADAAALVVLERCLVAPDPGGVLAESELAPYLEQVEAAFEQADPWAELGLEFECEACGHAWTAPFDIAAFVWEEIEARARGLLDEIHLLAGAYGWSERAILGLSEARRAAYLERLGL